MAFSEHLAQTSPYPMGLEIEKAEGCYLYDTKGKRYLDLIAGLAVANIGHRHPEVLSAIKHQMDKHLHVIPYGEFEQSIQNTLADQLCSILPSGLDCSYFVNSGTEANEAALKLAKRLTGRHDIVAIRGSYHGATHGSLSVTGNEIKKQAFRPLLPGITFVHQNNLEELSLIGQETAAVIIEPVLGDAGVRIPSKDYLMKLRERCNEVGAQLIFDEVQTGFGRTGKMFAFEHWGVVPDILTIAKAFGGGMPIGAFISSKEKMNTLTHSPVLGHITTFGGHPVSCASALATINVLVRENWIQEAEEKGQLFKQRLTHKDIVEVRQIGLMIAVEMTSEELVIKTINNLLKKGVVGFYFLSCRNAFRIAPPLCISSEEVNWACQQILSAIEGAAAEC
ncbi:MAG: aspartate aminotransferase family protein [Salibacteraceae bacterium]